VARWREALRFHVPLIEPDVRICRIRLSEKKVMLSPTGGSLYAHALLQPELPGFGGADLPPLPGATGLMPGVEPHP
jgi:hypothetical protein